VCYIYQLIGGKNVRLTIEFQVLDTTSGKKINILQVK